MENEIQKIYESINNLNNIIYSLQNTNEILKLKLENISEAINLDYISDKDKLEYIKTQLIQSVMLDSNIY